MASALPGIRFDHLPAGVFSTVLGRIERFETELLRETIDHRRRITLVVRCARCWLGLT